MKATAAAFLLLCVAPLGAGEAALDEALARAPVMEPQPDGVLCLSVKAAARLQWIGKQIRLAHDAGALPVENGRIVRWCGESERPCWRMRLPQAGKYRVTLTRFTAPGRESVVTVYFRGPKERRLTGRVEAGGTAEALQPWILGETDLDAGEHVVELRPVSWICPFDLFQLADLRLIPLDPLRQLERPVGDLAKRLGVDADPALAASAGRLRVLQERMAGLNRLVRTRDFTGFTGYAQFLEYDQAAARLAEAEREARCVEAEWDGLRRERLKALAAGDAIKPQERRTLDGYLASLDALADAATRSYPKAVFPPAPPGAPDGRETLFPVGRLDALPPQPIDTSWPRVALLLQPPPDAAARAARFARRNEAEGLASLYRALRAATIAGTPGLEAFERLGGDGRPREALEAYRAYFFDKLARPQRFGAATENILFELTRDRGKGHLLFAPSALALEQNRAGTAVVESRNEVLLGPVGEPGAACWVPFGLSLPPGATYARGPDSHPFWRTEAGKDAARKLEFFRCLPVLPSDRGEYQGGGLFPALFFSYAIAGDKASLARWCAYADDWCLHAKRDQEDFPLNVRNATELEPQQVRGLLTFLRIVLDERPALAEDFDPATLARILLKLTADYAPYFIRARRAEMANWGIMSLCHQMHISRFLHEFKAMGYFNRETWRLWNANFIQHRALDGENLEAWDEGHNPIDIDYAKQSVPFARLPAGVEEADRTAFWDHVRINERNLLVHLSPAGFYWPSWEAKVDLAKSATRARHLRPDTARRTVLDLVADEPGARQRIETVMTGGRPADGKPPGTLSDLAPYAAMAYLRESWRPEAEYLILQNVRERCQAQADCSRTMYSLTKGGRVLVEAHGLVVDRKPDNRYAGRVRTGGKTDFCGQAGRHIVSGRFHTSPAFDLAEALQDAPYALHRVQDRDPFGLYRQALPADDPDPIRDVTVLRQVFQVRGEGLWIACDRIASRGAAEREYAQFFALPVRLPPEGLADRVRLLAAAGHPLIEEDAAGARLRTANPGLDNVSIYGFASDRRPLRFAHVLNARREHDTLKKGPLEGLQAALASGRTPEQALELLGRRPVSVRFSAAGNAVFVAALATRPAGFDLERPFEGDVRSIEALPGGPGVAGFQAVTRTGARVWFQAGPEDANRLRCGPVEAEAESLLVVERPDGTTGGVVCGCTSWRVAGQPAGRGAADFEFALGPGAAEAASIVPVRCPIDTVRILPEANVFTDRVAVAFDIPTQKTEDLEFRYTLDGSEPTRASARFQAPVPLDRTTLVKVRAFRKGLTETPWHFTGTDCSRTASAVFRQRPLLPAQTAAAREPGLRYDYFEGDWPTLFAHAADEGVLAPASSGVAESLLDPALLGRVRSTDRAYAVRYHGWMDVPADGVYAMYAPVHLYTPTRDAGFDLRVFVDGEEWYPTPALHAEHVWHVPLARGLHRLKVSFVDYRWKAFRNEYWMTWREEEMWTGTPVLEVSGPGLARQPLPASWLRHGN